MSSRRVPPSGQDVEGKAYKVLRGGVGGTGAGRREHLSWKWTGGSQFPREGGGEGLPGRGRSPGKGRTQVTEGHAARAVMQGPQRSQVTAFAPYLSSRPRMCMATTPPASRMQAATTSSHFPALS